MVYRLGSLLDRVRWKEVSAAVGEQSTNREKYFPIISTFRWWARRQHAVIGALLEAAEEELGSTGLVISDPFSGGGTVAIEASRRGLPVYAQDLYPWPVRGLATALTQVPPEELISAGHELLGALDPLRSSYRHRDSGGEKEVSHILRVKMVRCSACESTAYLFRDPLISLASRRKGETEAFFGCRVCGGVSKRRADVKSFRCGLCRRRWPTANKERLGTDSIMRCPHGRHDITYASAGQSVGWKAVLIQERPVDGAQGSTTLRAARADDPTEDTPRHVIPEVLQEPIPDGVETKRLRSCGYHNWADLYTHRQVHVLLEALGKVKELNYSEPVRQRLALAVLGAAEMPGYLCRWDRYNLKAFEAIANHRYPNHTCVAAETNLLSDVGRGTLPRRILAAEKALSWLAAQHKAPQNVRCTSNHAAKREVGEGVLLAEGSSRTQLLADGAARLVLTDPPYHDDVQYGELARLFHVWLRCYDGTIRVDESLEATPNPRRGTDTESYEALVGECLAESRRTLAPGGRLILTFHNNDLSAWKALAGALSRAQFGVIGLAVVDSENASDHAKRGKKAFARDLVLECSPLADLIPGRPPLIATSADTEQAKNLLAVGLAVTEAVAEAVAQACASEAAARVDLGQSYRENLRHLGGETEIIR